MRTVCIAILALFAFVAVQAATHNILILDEEKITFYNTDSVNAIRAAQTITGLQTTPKAEELEALAWRPSTQQIYALAEDTHNLYIIDPVTAAATLVGTGPIDCAWSTTTDPDFVLSVNPVGDALRILGSDGSNRRYAFATGVCTVDTTITYFDGTTTTSYI